MGIEDRCRREAEKIIEQMIACYQLSTNHGEDDTFEMWFKLVSNALLQKEREIELLRSQLNDRK